MRAIKATILGLGLAFVLPTKAVLSEKLCLYKNSEGKVLASDSLRSIPRKYRKAAQCLDRDKISHLGKPDEIELEGQIRRENMLTSLGRMELRWPRKIELLFGRTPHRATADAARAVKKFLNTSGFPNELLKEETPWKIIFLDENLSDKPIPLSLVSNCHPAWMTPPANIYVVGQRVAAGCGNRQKSSPGVADGELASVLIHELAHVVEYKLLENNFSRSRMRAEGFASWFEQLAADHSSVISKGTVRKKYLALAKKSLARSPEKFYFRGSAEDYARASFFFHTLVKRQGLNSVAKIYANMKKNKLDFFPAIENDYGWSRARLDQEVAKTLSR